MKTLILKGEPKSTNHIYKSHCRFGRPCVYMSADGKGIKESYAWQAKSQWKRQPSEDDIALTVKLYFGTRRKNDIDNYNKILYDSMTRVVWVDDSQIRKVLTEKHYDKENPRIEVTVYELGKTSNEKV